MSVSSSQDFVIRKIVAIYPFFCHCENLGSRLAAIYFLDSWIASFIFLTCNDKSTHPLNPPPQGRGNLWQNHHAQGRGNLWRNHHAQGRGNLWIATTCLKASFAMTIWKQFADYLDLPFARTCKTHFFANDAMAQQRKKGN